MQGGPGGQGVEWDRWEARQQREVMQSGDEGASHLLAGSELTWSWGSRGSGRAVIVAVGEQGRVVQRSGGALRPRDLDQHPREGGDFLSRSTCQPKCRNRFEGFAFLLLQTLILWRQVLSLLWLAVWLYESWL